jgi:hypothetical protein
MKKNRGFRHWYYYFLNSTFWMLTSIYDHNIFPSKGVSGEITSFYCARETSGA